MTQQRDEQGPKKKLTLTDDDVVVSRTKRSGAVGQVGNNPMAPGGKVLDPNATRGPMTDVDA